MCICVCAKQISHLIVSLFNHIKYITKRLLWKQAVAAMCLMYVCEVMCHGCERSLQDGLQKKKYKYNNKADTF
jgi:hypothetical protein